jgi:exocyst complex component 5
MVTKDMTRYTNTLKDWEFEDDDIRTAIDVLLEVGSLFVVGPEALREKLRGNGPANNNNNNNANDGATRPAAASDVSAGFGLSVQDVRAYVMRRVDTNTVAMQNLLG